MVLKQCKFLLLHVLLVPLHLYYYYYNDDNDMYYVGLLCTLCAIPSPWYPPSTDKVQGLPNTGSPLVLCHWNQNRLTAFVERCNEYTKRGRKRRKKRERERTRKMTLSGTWSGTVCSRWLPLLGFHPFIPGWLALSLSLVVPYIASHSTARSGLLTCTCSSCCKGTTHVPYWQPQVVFLFDPL